MGRSASRAAPGIRPASWLIWIGVGIVLVALLTTMIASAFSVTVPNDFQDGYLALRVGMAFLGAVALGVGVWMRAAPTQSAKQWVDASPEEVLRASRAYVPEVWRAHSSGMLSRDAAMDFVEQLISPQLARARTTETIDITSNSVVRKCYLNFRPRERRVRGPRWGRGAAAPDLQYLPVVRFKRGHLIDGLTIKDRSGKRLTAMTNREYLVLLGVCIIHLIQASFDVRTGKDARQISAFFLGQCLPHRPLKDQETPKERSDWHRQRINTVLKRQVKDEVTARLLCNLVALAQTTYAVVIASDTADMQSYFELSYADGLLERVSLPAAKPTDPGSSARARLKSAAVRARDFYRTLKREARALLGIRPIDLYVDVSRATKSDSYHLELEAPGGNYVQTVRFYDERTGRRVRLGGNASVYHVGKPHFRCPKPYGGATAHLYTRGFSAKNDLGVPMLHIRFAEVPPGSIGRAWVVAVSLLLIIWVIGASPFYTLPNPSGSAAATAPAAANLSSLLFTVPIALTAVLGITASDRDGATLTARVSLLASGFVALVSLIVDQLMRAERLIVGAVWPSVALMKNPVWISLLIFSFLHVVLLGIRALYRFFSWRRLVRAGQTQRLP